MASMIGSAFQFPDSKTLLHSLNNLFKSQGASGDQINILAREPYSLRSTYPSEVVTCRLPDGAQLQLFCKYEAGRSHPAYGHRGGVAYEAAVYRHVLQPLPVSAPAFYGLHRDGTTGEMWLITEYIDQCLRGSFDPTLYHLAARWLGRFHRVNASYLSPASLPFLHRHDAEYYLGWADRTCRFAGPLHERFPWLTTLCQRFERVVDLLLEPSGIIIHGEYYPGNILYCAGTIYPVDWESAAIGAGEIDLASLTEHWPPRIVARCKDAYISARWPEGAPDGLEQKLDVARLYWLYRWLGDRPEWTAQEESRWRFDHLRRIGERLGLI